MWRDLRFILVERKFSFQALTERLPLVLAELMESMFLLLQIHLFIERICHDQITLETFPR